MLAMVLLLVLAAAGLLGAAVAAAAPQLGWFSLALTVLAGMLLVVDSRRRKARSTETSSGSAGRHRLSNGATQEAQIDRRHATTPARQSSGAHASSAQRTNDASGATKSPGSTVGSSDPAGAVALVDVAAHAGTTVPGSSAAEDPAAGTSAAGASLTGASLTGAAGATGSGPGTPENRPQGFIEPEPGVEQSDVGSSTKAELNTEIRVIDEHPRYHLSDCEWLTRQATAVPLPLLLRQAQVLGFTPCAHCAPNVTLARRFRGDKF